MLAITPGDLSLSPQAQGIDGPLFIGIDTHALSAAGVRERARGAGRQRRRNADREGRRIHADAGGVARDSRLQPRPRRPGSPTASSSRRRTIRPTTAASNTTRRTAVPPTPTSPAGSKPRPTRCSKRSLKDVRRIPFDRGAARGDHARTRFSRAPMSAISAA